MYWIKYVIPLPFILLVALEWYLYCKMRKTVLEPIKDHITGNKAGARGQIVNLHGSYSKCSNREVLIQNHLLDRYTDAPTFVDKIVDLFAKLMLPLMTFMLLIAMNWMVSVFQSVNAKIDKDQLDKFKENVNNFQDSVNEFYNAPILFIFIVIASLIFCSIMSHSIQSIQNNFLKSHKDMVARIIMERGIEKSSLCETNKQSA